MLKDYVTSENPPNPVMGDWGRNRTRKSIDEKPPKLDEEMWEKNQKIILLKKKLSNLN